MDKLLEGKDLEIYLVREK